MNKRWQTVWMVTKWEFNRFFKWMDLVKVFLFLFTFGLIGGLVGHWLDSDSVSVPEIAVADYGVFNPESFNEAGNIRFINRSEVPYDELLEQLDEGRFDAILTVESPEEATIRMHNERGWLTPLRQVLQDERTVYMLQKLDIDQDMYSSIEAEMALTTHFDRGGDSSGADKIVAAISIMLVLTAVFLGFAYQFSAITAEKQQRITEQVISAISPQTWIDGKILGITGIGLTYVVFYGGMSLIAALFLVKFAGAPFAAGLALVNPAFVIVFLILSLLGILMWNSFLAAIAATIDDPNSSERTVMMFLPMLPVLFAFYTLANPDGFAIRVLGIFPLTSYAVLPARMVMSQVVWWEPVLALGLLLGTVWLFRLAAGKIFAAGMMMYGKEPSLKEMWHWFRVS